MRGDFCENDGKKSTYTALNENITADAVIIGGGLCGALCAYYAFENGLNPVIIDCGLIASGNTKYLTGEMNPQPFGNFADCVRLFGNDGAVGLYREASKAVDRIEKICEKTGNNTDFERRSLFYYTDRQKDTDLMREIYRLSYHNGIISSFLKYENCLDMFSFPFVCGILRQDVAAVVSPIRLTEAILGFVSVNGGSVYENSCATVIISEKGGFTVKTRNGSDIKTKYVLDCRGTEGDLTVSAHLIAISRRIHDFRGWYKTVNLCDTYKNPLRIYRHRDRLVASLRLPPHRPRTTHMLNSETVNMSLAIKNMFFGIERLSFENVFCHICKQPSGKLPFFSHTDGYVAIGNLSENAVLYADIIAKGAVESLLHGKSTVPSAFCKEDFDE